MSIVCTPVTAANAAFGPLGRAAWTAGMSWGGSDASFASGVLTIGGSTAGAGIVVTGGTVTASTPYINSTQTWNSAGVVFVGETSNITSTAASNSSLVREWKVGNATVCDIDKWGMIRVGGSTRTPDAQFGICSAGNLLLGAANTDRFMVAADQMRGSSTGGFYLTSGALGGSVDSGLSRISAGLWGVGTGTQGSFAGTTKQAALVTTAAASSFGAGTVCIGGTTQTTIGANGGASALTALPLGYLLINVAGTSAVIPYYNS